mgnify:CR=1 FL=1
MGEHMGIVMIAIIYQNNRLAGFGLLDSENEQIKDVPYESVVRLISSKKVVANLEYKDNRVVTTTGDIDNYTKIIDGEPFNSNRLIILSRNENSSLKVNW